MARFPTRFHIDSLPSNAVVRLAYALALVVCVAGEARSQGRAMPVGRGAVEGGATALVGATVIDVATGVRHADQVVVVQGGRVREVVPRVAWRRTPGTRSVGVEGRFIIPGLWDMHVEEALPVWDRAPLDSNARLFHPLFLANGVTGVRDVSGDLAVLRRWRTAIERGERLGPRIVYTGPKIGMAPVAPGLPRPLRSREDVEATVGALQAAGATGVYLLSLDDALLPVLAAATRRHGLRLEGGVPEGGTLGRQLEVGQSVVDHLDDILASCATDETVRWKVRVYRERPWWARALWKVGVWERSEYPDTLLLASFSQARAESLFVHLAKARVYQVPTLRLMGVLNRAADSAVRLPPAPLELRPPPHRWRGWASEPQPPGDPLSRIFARQLWVVAAMARAGVPILAGSDTPNLYAAPGLALHDELELLVRAGLSPLQAIQSATLRPAEYLSATDSLGTVAAGRVADLVVLQGDPTLDIRNTRRIEMVMTRGRLLDAAALARLREEGTAMARGVEAYWAAREGRGR